MQPNLNLMKVLGFIEHQPRTVQGPQGNDVTDYYGEYLDRYGSLPEMKTLGSEGILDRRDNRDPQAVGQELLKQREILMHDDNTYSGA